MADAPNFMQRGLVLNVTPPERSGADGQKILDRLAVMVGVVAFGLPVILIIGATLGTSCFRDSISHFYHAQFLGGFFVGLLFFIGGFLIAYSGDHWMETWGSAVAGLMAMGVALFPTSGSGCESATAYEARVFADVTNVDHAKMVYSVAESTKPGQTYFNLFGTASDWHLIAAGVVFVYLGFFCLLVLRRVIPRRHGEGSNMLRSKRNRNTLYFWCGVVILLCVAVLALKKPVLGDLTRWNSYNLTFWVELMALWAFGLAWVTKGRIFKTLNDA